MLDARALPAAFSRPFVQRSSRPGFIALLIVWILLPAGSVAQTTTGTLLGRAVTPDGSPVPEVTVTATGPNLQGERERITDATGFFQYLALPPGQYTIRLTRIGLRPLVVREVLVELGHATPLGALVLDTEPMELEPIVVRAAEAAIDPVHTTVGATLRPSDYALLPGERDYKSAIQLLPHVTESYRGDVANVAGQTGPETAYFIDGMNATSPLWGGGDATRLPYNFIRAVEVKTGGYQAEYGKALGAVVNAVTYSGTNEHEAAVFGFMTNSELAAESKAEPSLRTEGFWSYDVGARVSGPLLRDRLWYSAAYNPKFERADREIEGHGMFEDRKTAHLFAGKLTWRAAPALNVEFSVLGDPATHDAVAVTHWVQRSWQPGDPDSYLTRRETGGITGSVRATANLGRNWLLEGSVTTSSFRDRYTPRTDAESPFFEDWLTNTVRGAPFNWFTYDMWRAAATLRSTLILGSHTITAGAEYEHSAIDHDSEVYYVQRQDVAAYGRWTESTPGGTTGSRIPTVYVQDSWRVADRLTLNGGVRWSSQYLISQTGEVAQRFLNEWQPRAGFVLQLGRPGTQRLYGSYGRFYQTEPALLGSLFYKDYRVLIEGCDSDPREAGAACVAGKDEVTEPMTYANAPGNPEVDNLDEFILGYELSLGDAVTVGVRGIHRDLRSSFLWGVPYDPAIRNPPTVVGTPGRGDLDFLPDPRREYTALELSADGGVGGLQYRASYVLSRSYGNYTGFFASDNGTLKPGGNATFQVPQHAQLSTGLLPNDRTHVFKLAGSYTTPFGVAGGAVFTWQSGTPLNEFGKAGPSIQDNMWKTFLVPRGSVGRSPDLWNVDLRLAYDAPCPGTRQCRVLLDWLHVGNPQEAAWLDELHYHDMDVTGQQIRENPNYLQPVAYQPPMMLRLGLEAGW